MHRFPPLIPKTRIWLLALSICLLVGCSSFSLGVINTLARFGDYTASRDLSYGDSEAQRLDVFRPSGAERAPIVVFFYGGSWQFGSKSDYLFVAQALTSRGFVAVLPDYRKFPEVRFPDFVEDGARAVAFVRERAEQFGGDADQIFVMGHSAGAHIAALLALDPRYLEAYGGGRLRGMVGLAGPYDFNARRADLREIFERVPYETTQPLHFAERARSPLMLLHGKADRTVFLKNTVNLAAAVERFGGSAETRFYLETDHAGILAALSIPLRSSSSVLDDIESFVRSNAGQSSQAATSAAR